MGPRLTTLAAILVLSATAHAGAAEELTAAINNCAAMTDDVMRHACYDGLPTLLKTLPPVAEPIPADHITATVETFTYDYGLFIVNLDNGQVWRQVSAGDGRVSFSTEKKDKVAIWRGSFGNVLRIEGYPPTYRVRRIK